MKDGFEAFRSVNFDWTRQLKSVWRDPDYHVAGLHQQALDDVIDYFVSQTVNTDPDNEPLGRVIVGPKGFGKTHLIGELRRQVWEREGWFVLIDLIGIKDFWSSVALGFLNSLQVRMPDGKTQYDRLVLRMAKLVEIDNELRSTAERWRGQPRDLMTELVRLFRQSFARKYRDDVSNHLDVVTALVLLISEDLDCHSVAHGWLQGMSFDGEDVRALGFRGNNSAEKVVQGLSWIMSRTAPTLIAIDQIDAIVTASKSRAREADNRAAQEQTEAQSIVDALAQGLMDLHEYKRRAVTVVSCLEATWNVLEDTTSIPMEDRYHPPLPLQALGAIETARALVTARLQTSYVARGFTPRFSTWPFADSAFESAVGLSPRELLKACDHHLRKCIAAGQVSVSTSFDPAQPLPSKEAEKTAGLDEAFQRELRVAVIANLTASEGEDQFQQLIDGNLRLLEKHFDLPDDIDSEVQRDPDQKRPSLHGRLSFTFLNEGNREQHYCFRLLEHTNARAFQTRLKAAMTASGIDTALKFRHLFILRRCETPGGPRTRALVEQFQSAGGKFISPTDDDLRAFVALAAMESRNLPEFDAWLQERQPLYESRLFQEAGLCPPPFFEAKISPAANERSSPQAQGKRASVTARPTTPQDQAAQTPARVASRRSDDVQAGKPNAPPTAPAQPGHSEERVIPIGRRYERATLGEALALKASALSSHTAILAGSGSGKTVLLRRIVEEAALLGIPSIVLDPNNDLSRLGDAWPTRPDTWSDEEAAKSTAYGARADVVIWTPGVTSGNPISLNLLPDFAAIGNNRDSETEDERAQAVEMARATLGPYVGGSGQKMQLKQGVIADALRTFARKGGGTLDELIALLSDLPENVSKIGNASKLAREIADQLLAAISTNPLLQSQGQTLHPKTLFEGVGGKTRVSVINLGGLVSEDARESFVNRLQISLFTFIKRHPSATGRLYVLDEAQNFAPSGRGTACKASALSLVAQARKYGLGMIFATQAPKGLDNKIILNCTTQFYGKMGSETDAKTVKQLIQDKGGAADDIGKLPQGEFYFSTEGSLRPFKVHTPLCLSWHPPTPPTADEVLQKARTKRG
jgi:Helicase HerA, central domain